MTVRHHPHDALILDYATGGLGEAAGLAVASHLALCPLCRTTNRLLDGVGGKLICEHAPASSDDAAFESLMRRVASDPAPAAPAAPPPSSVLPQPLREYLGCDLDGVPWKRLGRGAYHYVIPTRDKGATARLLRIPAGRPVPVHTHNGLELTLVLCGAFSDVTGTYARGDLQDADDSLIHQPHAAPGEDCICLAVTEAPLRFKSWAARLVQPFLGI